MAEPAGHGDVDELLASTIEKHHIRKDHGDVRFASAQVEIEIPIVVEISKITAHGEYGGRNPLSFRDIGKVSLAIASEVPCHTGLMRFAQIAEHEITHLRIVGRDEDIQMAIVVEIPDPGWETKDWLSDARRLGDVLEGAVPLISIEAVGTAEIGDSTFPKLKSVLFISC